MNRSAGKSANSGAIDHQIWCRLFRRLYPTKTVESVAADLGAPPRTVENWMRGVAAPSLLWFLVIVDTYGPQVMAEVMPRQCGWLSRALRDEQRAQLEAEQRRIEREMAALDAVHP